MRERLPLEFALDLVFLFAMYAAQKRDVLMVTREQPKRLGEVGWLGVASNGSLPAGFIRPSREIVGINDHFSRGS